MRRFLTCIATALTLISCGASHKKDSLKLKAAPHSATLSWTQGTVTSGSPPVTGNNVYRGTTSGSETLLISLTTPSTSYVDSAVTAGTMYCYEVTAVNSQGESLKSNEECGTIPNPQVPGAPVLSSPVVVATTAPCVNSGYQAWTSVPIPPQSGNFEIQMDAKPNTSLANDVILLGPAQATSFTQDYVYLRFWTTGMIQALNGPNYGAVNAMPYVAGGTYHLTIDVNKTANTFSAYVGTTTRTAIASNYAFHSGPTTAPISYITLYNYSPTGASDSICNTTILSYPIAS